MVRTYLQDKQDDIKFDVKIAFLGILISQIEKSVLNPKEGGVREQTSNEGLVEGVTIRIRTGR